MIKGNFTYYSDLYIKLRHAYAEDQNEFRAIYFNSLLDLDAPFHLVLSACLPNDPQDADKIRSLAREIDRYFSLLQLQSAYDSNDFADSLFQISEAIRGRAVDTYRPAFNAQLKAMIAARRNVQDAEPLSYAAFKQTGSNLNTRFKRYFFARIDDFLAENMNMNPKHPMYELVTRTGAKSGFHVAQPVVLAREVRAVAK